MRNDWNVGMRILAIAAALVVTSGSARASDGGAAGVAEKKAATSGEARATAPTETEVLRTEVDRLRDLVERLQDGDSTALPAWGEAMLAHVRFEERSLFPLAERTLDLTSLADSMSRAASPLPMLKGAP